MHVIVGMVMALVLALPGQSSQAPSELPAASAAASVSATQDGSTVWIRSAPGGAHEMLQIWRRGKQVRIFSHDGGYPGDGKDCSWGSVRNGRFVGMQQRVAPDPIRMRFRLHRTGSKMWTPGFTDGAGNDRRPWRRGTLEKYHRPVPESRQTDRTWCLNQHPLPAASTATYWFDREPSSWLGAMVVVTKADTLYAFASYFEGKSCYVGRIDSSSVRLNGAHEYASIVRLTETWPVQSGMARPTTTYGTAGEWRQVARRAFRDRDLPVSPKSAVRAVGRLADVTDVRKKCRWAGLSIPDAAAAPAPQPVSVPAPATPPVCWATGIQLTDGSNQTTEDDARQFTSSLWYGVDWNGGRGYVPAVWTTKREDHLGLPAC